MTAALAFAAAPVLAQSVPQAASTTNTPAPESIGPSALQDFSLKGEVTRPAEPVKPAATVSAAARTSPPLAAPRGKAEQPSPRGVTAEKSGSDLATEAANSRLIAPTQTASAAAPDDKASTASTSLLPPVISSPAPTPASTAGFTGEPAGAPIGLAPERHAPMWPWLLLAVVLGAAGAFLFWRNRSREAFAGGARIDAFVPPDPVAPRPQPAPPAPPKAPLDKPSGIVSTRLRPWIEIGFNPLRCIVEEQRIVVDFEVALLNSGNAMAEGVLIEASLFNASPSQDQEIGGFFANPVAQGDRIAAIAPKQRLELRTQVALPRDQIRTLEAGGRHVFVPLIAFNALYRWSAGDGQTSVGFLLGRDTTGEKMAPFRIDLGPRLFRGLGARPLPLGVRR